MADFLLLMHDDSEQAASPAMWERYFARLNASGVFAGGSSIGEGRCLRKAGPPAPLSPGLVGHVRVQADDIEQAMQWVVGNRVYETGGTVEVRASPRLGGPPPTR